MRSGTDNVHRRWRAVCSLVKAMGGGGVALEFSCIRREGGVNIRARAMGRVYFYMTALVAAAAAAVLGRNQAVAAPDKCPFESGTPRRARFRGQCMFLCT